MVRKTERPKHQQRQAQKALQGEQGLCGVLLALLLAKAATLWLGLGLGLGLGPWNEKRRPVLEADRRCAISEDLFGAPPTMSASLQTLYRIFIGPGVRLQRSSNAPVWAGVTRLADLV